MSPDGATLAHGIGGAKDLPISPELAIAGGVAALVVSFTVLAVAWRSPRYDEATSGRVAPAWLTALVDSPAYRIALRVFGVVVMAYAAVAAVLGKDLLTNPIFGMFYVWWWVGLVPLSFVLGPVWKAISPVRTINQVFARLSGSDPDKGVFDYPERLGHWPAAVGLFAFVWMELVYPYSTELGPVRLWCAGYVAVMLLGGALFGSTFYARADPFEVYSSLVAKMSIWGRRDDRLVIRSPLANLDTVVARPGLVAVVAVLFGSTAFDSFRDSVRWVKFVQDSSLPTFLLNNVAMLTFCVVVGLVFALGCVLTGVGDDLDRAELPNRFAHSVVPIIVGYIVAHYLTYLVEVGQSTLILASDPLGNGSNLLGTADLSVNYWLSYHPTLLASTKVLAVVLGHVLGVVAAHDRAVRILPPRHQLTGQLPLLFAMVAFTVGGLYLLFAA
ncbi:MAG: hypothetical protein JWO76_1536 [Nocardioides sp.]|nr:hypothetical protein [Nocardioides sp.]